MSTYSARTRQTSPFGPEAKFMFERPRLDVIDGKGKRTTTTTRGGSEHRGIQITESEGHPWPRKGHELTDLGGPFYTRKVYIADMSHRRITMGRNQGDTSYIISGDVLSPVSLPNFQFVSGRSVLGYPDRSTDEEDLMVLGTEAIAACSPVTPVMSLPTAIGELVRDGLPTIMGLKSLKGKGKPSAVADDYLNYQFGIKPLLEDVKSLAYGLQNADKLIAQLSRDSGKVVRRRINLPTDIQTTETNLGLRTVFSYFGNDPRYWGGTSETLKGTLIETRTVEKRRWFSGAFTYHLPTNGEYKKVGRMAQDAERILGLNPDVSDVWNLLPWSWLGDWFYDVGPILQNVSNAQNFGQVLPYAYMMEHTIVKYEYTMNHPGNFYQNNQIRGPFTLTIHDEVKKRVAATPYGFGSSWEEFSPYQLSILAALGISRGSQSAR